MMNCRQSGCRAFPRWKARGGEMGPQIGTGINEGDLPGELGERMTAQVAQERLQVEILGVQIRGISQDQPPLQCLGGMPVPAPEQPEQAVFPKFFLGHDVEKVVADLLAGRLPPDRDTGRLKVLAVQGRLGRGKQVDLSRGHPPREQPPNESAESFTGPSRFRGGSSRYDSTATTATWVLAGAIATWSMVQPFFTFSISFSLAVR